MIYNLRQELEAFVSGHYSVVAFARGLSAFCRAEPEAAWDALALIDQYHRRGKISVGAYRTLSHGLERQLLGLNADANATVPAMSPELVTARGQVHRYRKCLTMLARIDRRNRDALAKALRDVEQLKRDLELSHQERRDGHRGRWQARIPVALCVIALILSSSAR